MGCPPRNDASIRQFFIQVRRNQGPDSREEKDEKDEEDIVCDGDENQQVYYSKDGSLREVAPFESNLGDEPLSNESSKEQFFGKGGFDHCYE